MTKKFYVFSDDNLLRPQEKNAENVTDLDRIYIYDALQERPLAVPRLGDINKNNFYIYNADNGKVEFGIISSSLPDNTTPTPTPSVTSSVTPTPTPSVTSSITPTPTPSVTSSITPTPTPTSSVTPTPTPSVTSSVTPTPTPSVTSSITPTPTPTSSVTPTPTPSVTSSITPTPWDLSTASYDSVSFGVGTQDGLPFGLAFSSDGAKMYMVGLSSKTIYQYTLSTAWDLSTASYDSVSFYLGTQDSQTRSIAFSSNGAKMYMVGNGSDSFYQYTLATPWDVSTAIYFSVSFGVGTQDANPFDIAFSSDGTKMYMVGVDTDTVYQYTLSTAWDLSTASYDSVSFGVDTQDTSPYGIAFSSDGTKMYMVGASTDTVYQYTLSTAWDLSTASYDSVSFGVGTQDTSPFGLAFSSDGAKMYMVGNVTDTVYQYSV